MEKRENKLLIWQHVIILSLSTITIIFNSIAYSNNVVLNQTAGEVGLHNKILALHLIQYILRVQKRQKSKLQSK